MSIYGLFLSDRFQVNMENLKNTISFLSAMSAVSSLTSAMSLLKAGTVLRGAGGTVVAYSVTVRVRISRTVSADAGTVIVTDAVPVCVYISRAFFAGVGTAIVTNTVFVVVNKLTEGIAIITNHIVIYGSMTATVTVTGSKCGCTAYRNYQCQSNNTR